MAYNLFGERSSLTLGVRFLITIDIFIVSSSLCNNELADPLFDKGVQEKYDQKLKYPEHLQQKHRYSKVYWQLLGLYANYCLVPNCKPIACYVHHFLAHRSVLICIKLRLLQTIIFLSIHWAVFTVILLYIFFCFKLSRK